LIQGLEKGPSAPARSVSAPMGSRASAPEPPRSAPRPPAISNAATVKAVEARREASAPPAESSSGNGSTPASPTAAASASVAAAAAAPAANQPAASGSPLKDAFLDELRKTKKYFYGTVIAQAQRIDVEADRIVLTFAPQHRALRQQFDQTRASLE